MNIFIMNRCISKSYTGSKNTIYKAGAAVVSTITSVISIGNSHITALYDDLTNPVVMIMDT